MASCFPVLPMNEASTRTTADVVGAARRLYERHGKHLLEDPSVRSALERYLEAIRRTGGSMRTAGVAAACAACAVDGPGSCCFRDIQDCYDPVLLLINLLLGCDVPDAAELEGECFFLGRAGCRLVARYAFCLNYLCPSLKESLAPEAGSRLLAAVGEELDCGWKLELIIRKRITPCAE